MQIGNYKSFSSSFKSIVKKEGFIGLYRGYFITVMREIPFSTIQFPLYEFLKRKIKGNDLSLNLYESSICGATAGAVSAILTTPLDVIKTRIMTIQDVEANLSGRINKICKLIIKENGFIGFFSGLKWRVIFITCGGVCFFGTNEFIKKRLNYKY